MSYKENHKQFPMQINDQQNSIIDPIPLNDELMSLVSIENFQSQLHTKQFGLLPPSLNPFVHLSMERQLGFQSQNQYEQHVHSLEQGQKQEETPQPETNFDILLNKHLNNHEITDIELQQLPEHERIVFEQIQNKSNRKGKTKNNSRSQVSCNNKRSDQCQKLFYKKAFKYSQNKYFKRCKNNKNKSRKMSQFYHYHFDTVAQENNLSITSFYHPNKKTKPGLVVQHRSFNAKYIKLLMKSKTFLLDIKQYHRLFINDCLAERRRKVISFTKSLQRNMERAQQDSRIVVKYLQSSQCKIPWTLNQIQETWELAQRDLDEIDGKGIENGDHHQQQNDEMNEQLKNQKQQNEVVNKLEHEGEEQSEISLGQSI